MVLRRVPAALAILFVLLVYVFFASEGTFEFRRVKWDYKTDKPGEGYYGSLAEGFRSGHLYMMDEPDANLKAVHNPYDPAVRDKYGAGILWDASYFERHFYLYFSPLPVLLFYLPFRWLTQGYPLDSLAGTFFCVWAFAMSIATVRRAAGQRKLHLPMPLWILLIGLGNVIPWSLIHMRIYEVAVMAGMAMTATWGYALVRFTETGSARHAFWMGLWLALAIAARTNLVVLLLPTVSVLWSGARFGRRPVAEAATAPRVWRVWIACLIPLGVVALMLAGYNYARFRKPHETGITYQLTFVNMRNCRRCSLRTIPEGIRVINNLVHYVWWPPYIFSKFPYVDLQGSRLDPIVAFPNVVEHIAGFGPLNPVIVVACIFTLLLAARRRTLDVHARNGLRLMGGAWLVLALLSTCWYVVARYSLDFWMLMTVASAIVIEAAFTELENAGFGLRWLRIGTIALACFSILFCSLLGFMGTQGAFQRANPKLFQRLSDQLSAS
jgi:hypothetical protein